MTTPTPPRSPVNGLFTNKVSCSSAKLRHWLQQSLLFYKPDLMEALKRSFCIGSFLRLSRVVPRCQVLPAYRLDFPSPLLPLAQQPDPAVSAGGERKFLSDCLRHEIQQKT